MKKTSKITTAKILAITLPAKLHLRFLKEAKTYNGEEDRHKEKFLFSLMEKYLAMSRKKKNPSLIISRAKPRREKASPAARGKG